jgi:glycosyltransferase involved in cell wall biosynthesis
MKVWLVVDTPGWSYDINARAIAAQLAERYEFRVVYGAAEVDAQADDVVVDFWWKGAARHPRLIRQVSSHRWALGAFGSLSAEDLHARHLADARVVIVPSQRLERLLGGSCPVMRTPKGFDPEMFHDRGEHSGQLSVGWAGAIKPDKGIRILKQACPDLRIATKLPYTEMPGFYASCDVITCASTAEGDPRPLIEGMACGCFPVTVDVGIAPELVRHGIDGLVVERTPQAFAEAFAWCRANLDYVRAAGRANAERMLATRTWTQVAPAWAAAIEKSTQA